MSNIAKFRALVEFDGKEIEIHVLEIFPNQSQWKHDKDYHHGWERREIEESLWYYMEGMFSKPGWYEVVADYILDSYTSYFGEHEVNVEFKDEKVYELTEEQAGCALFIEGVDHPLADGYLEKHSEEEVLGKV